MLAFATSKIPVSARTALPRTPPTLRRLPTAATRTMTLGGRVASHTPHAASIDDLQQSPAATPHSAYHYASHSNSSNRNIFEGWYLRVTLPEGGPSFVFIHAVQNPVGGAKELRKVCSQVMWSGGELGEGYLMQHGRDTDAFWADSEVMAIGGAYHGHSEFDGQNAPKHDVDTDEFFKRIESGFQATETKHTGILHPTSPEGDMLNAVLPEAKQATSTAHRVRWAYSSAPIHAWGGRVAKNRRKVGHGDRDFLRDVLPISKNGAKSTTGWLAASPLFDPQWQIVTAHAVASGFIEVDDKRIEFTEADAYIEKNWGAGFPSKWFWLQCNSFETHPDLTVTAVGARRHSVQPVGGEVDVGIIGVHWGDEFIEAVPWNAAMHWDVEWGRWKMTGGNTTYEVEITATTHEVGTWLRGPHAEVGFVPMCRDACGGHLTLRIWRRQGIIDRTVAAVANAVGAQEERPRGELVLEAQSDVAAVEIGGGPWEHAWKTDCEVPSLILESLKLDL